jgi:hypothetical protein
MALLTPTSFAVILLSSSIAAITIMWGLSPHSSLRHVTASPIIFGIAYRSRIIGLPLMPVFQPLPPHGSLIMSMISYVKSEIATLRFFHPDNSLPRLRMFKPLSTAPLPRAFLIARDGSKHFDSNLDLAHVRDIVHNPALLSKDTLKDIPFNYHFALRQALITI